MRPVARLRVWPPHRARERTPVARGDGLLGAPRREQRAVHVRDDCPYAPPGQGALRGRGGQGHPLWRRRAASVEQRAAAREPLAAAAAVTQRRSGREPSRDPSPEGMSG
ncbi:unnamed protein product [Prorocentrum cordatum]|uniref:Uncharacterized protein n=1 Tax=Prorocentrum cordatum TaxID=2364126 RepID=A0ABN9V850_9DINO|nr:unnamed protein product [Polarella glacialis]